MNNVSNGPTTPGRNKLISSTGSLGIDLRKSGKFNSFGRNVEINSSDKLANENLFQKTLGSPTQVMRDRVYGRSFFASEQPSENPKTPKAAPQENPVRSQPTQQETEVEDSKTPWDVIKKVAVGAGLIYAFTRRPGTMVPRASKEISKRAAPLLEKYAPRTAQRLTPPPGTMTNPFFEKPQYLGGKEPVLYIPESFKATENEIRRQLSKQFQGKAIKDIPQWKWKKAELKANIKKYSQELKIPRRESDKIHRLHSEQESDQVIAMKPKLNLQKELLLPGKSLQEHLETEIQTSLDKMIKFVNSHKKSFISTFIWNSANEFLFAKDVSQKNAYQWMDQKCGEIAKEMEKTAEKITADADLLIKKYTELKQRVQTSKLPENEKKDILNALSNIINDLSENKTSNLNKLKESEDILNQKYSVQSMTPMEKWGLDGAKTIVSELYKLGGSHLIFTGLDIGTQILIEMYFNENMTDEEIDRYIKTKAKELGTTIDEDNMQNYRKHVKLALEKATKKSLEKVIGNNLLKTATKPAVEAATPKTTMKDKECKQLIAEKITLIASIAEEINQNAIDNIKHKEERFQTIEKDLNQRIQIAATSPDTLSQKVWKTFFG